MAANLEFFTELFLFKKTEEIKIISFLKIQVLLKKKVTSKIEVRQKNPFYEKNKLKGL